MGANANIPVRGFTHRQSNTRELAIPNPIISASQNWMASCVITGHLYADIQRRTEFWTGYHALLMKEGFEDIRRRNVQNVKAVLEETMSTAPALIARQLIWVTRKG